MYILIKCVNLNWLYRISWKRLRSCEWVGCPIGTVLYCVLSARRAKPGVYHIKNGILSSESPSMHMFTVPGTHTFPYTCQYARCRNELTRLPAAGRRVPDKAVLSLLLSNLSRRNIPPIAIRTRYVVFRLRRHFAYSPNNIIASSAPAASIAASVAAAARPGTKL